MIKTLFSRRSVRLLVSSPRALLFAISYSSHNTSPGHINRHKNALNSDQQSHPYPRTQNSNYGGMDDFTQSTAYSTDKKGYPQSSTAWRSSRGGYPSRGYPRGGRATQVHRNRTLVLNGNTPTLGTGAAVSNENVNIPGSRTNAGAAWVTKQDRHLQLINTTIFEKDSQKRAQAIEQTRQQKLKQRDEREKARIVKHLQRGTSVRPTGITSNNELDVNGIRFRVVQGGSKLVKVPGEDWPRNASGSTRLGGPVMSLQWPGDLNAAKSTPKSAMVGGVRFYRSKSGNMYRSGIIKAYRYGQPPFILISCESTATALIYFVTGELGSLRRLTSPARSLQQLVFPFFAEPRFSTLSISGERYWSQLTHRFAF